MEQEDVNTHHDRAVSAINTWFRAISFGAILGGTTLALLGAFGSWQALTQAMSAMDMGVALATIAAGVAAIWIGLFGLIVLHIGGEVRKSQVVTFALPTVVANRLSDERATPIPAHRQTLTVRQARPVLTNLFLALHHRLWR